MLDPKLETALNQHINRELAAWYTYLAMSAYFDRLHLSGFARFMDAQAREEQTHAHRLFRYLLDRGGNVDLQEIASPKHDYGSVREAFAAALENEKSNTKAIYELYETAKDVNDYATVAALQWFLDEQVEEEKTMDELLGLVDFAADDKSALLTLNRDVGARRSGGDGADAG